MHQNSYGSGCAVLRDVMHTQTKVKNQKTSLSPTLRITISSFIYLAHHNIYYYYYEKITKININTKNPKLSTAARFRVCCAKQEWRVMGRGVGVG
jgi:hypothetical protein